MTVQLRVTSQQGYDKLGWGGRWGGRRLCVCERVCVCVCVYGEMFVCV